MSYLLKLERICHQSCLSVRLKPHSINATGILKDFMANNLAVNNENFLEEIIKPLKKRSLPLLNLELIKTNLVVQQWYKSTSRRIMDLQKSMGAPLNAADRP